MVCPSSERGDGCSIDVYRSYAAYACDPMLYYHTIIIPMSIAKRLVVRLPTQELLCRAPKRMFCYLLHNFN